jgi:16S rRNA (cytosine967-C5)-methyltransferase
MAQQETDTPRRIALTLIGAVLGRRRPLDEALAGHAELARLDARDRAFVRALVGTTLRRLGQIDDLVGRLLERPLPATAARARNILRVGASQILFLDVPAYAAVDTAVNLAQHSRCGTYKPLINAVLRTLARDGRDWMTSQDAARLNTPDWLWRSWAGAYGPETCRRIAEAHLVEAPLDLTAKKRPEIWSQRLGAEILPSGSLRLQLRGPVEGLPGFAAGAWWVQDAAAALPAALLGEVRGSNVIDLCAAPGGKTAQLAARGARVVAVDRSAKRMQRLEANLARLGLGARIEIADVLGYRPDELADAVFLDAPCSATGTIRRHPDIPRIKRADEIPALTAIQHRMLRAALAMVRPGGLVVYAACSLQPEEGGEIVHPFIGPDGTADRVPIEADEIGGWAALIDAEGDLRTLPCHMAEKGGMDGFYACRLRRR